MRICPGTCTTLLVLFASALGCSSSSSDGAAGAGGRSSAKPDAGLTDAPILPDATSADSHTQPDTTTSDAKADVGPVGSCSELTTNDCFSNNECKEGRRCEDVGADGAPVPCCVPGERGKGLAGSTCKNENDCESAVCIEQVCSKTCKTVDDCPTGMKDCRFIAYSGSDDMWCFPK